MNQIIENRLKKISIRGRMALGIKCLEINLEELDLIDNVECRKLLSNLWDFISSNQLDLWEEKILDFDPESLIEEVEIIISKTSKPYLKMKLKNIIKFSKNLLMNCLE